MNLKPASALTDKDTILLADFTNTTGDPVFNSPWSFTGLPTASFPIAFSPDGLPLSLQLVGRHWEHLPEPRPSLSLEIVLENQKDVMFINLGPHPPRLWPEDIDLVHRLWLELSGKGPGAKLHHRDIVGVALRRMEAELHSSRAPEVVDDIVREVAGGNHASDSKPESPVAR